MEDISKIILGTGSYAEVVSKIEKILAERKLMAEITAGMIYQPEGESKKHLTLHLAFDKFDEEAMKALENCDF